MCIPLSIPCAPLPHYIHLDRSSQWHTFALLSAAWESVSLPSRLRLGHTKRGFLDDMVASLNVNGAQRMASLQCSLLDPNQVKGNDAALSRASNDQRMPGPNTSSRVLAQHDAQEANASFDVDLSGEKTSSAALVPTRQTVEDHIFSSIEVVRDKKVGPNDEGSNERDEMMTNKRRRLAGASIFERSVLLHYGVDCTQRSVSYGLQLLICKVQHVVRHIEHKAANKQGTAQVSIAATIPGTR